MGISSHELVPRDNHPEPSSRSVKALIKHIEKRQLHTAIHAIDREYDRVDHTHLTETVLGAAERDRPPGGLREADSRHRRRRRTRRRDGGLRDEHR